MIQDHSDNKKFHEMTDDEQEEQNYFDLQEIKDYYGSWDKVLEMINDLKEVEDEKAFERATGANQ